MNFNINRDRNSSIDKNRWTPVEKVVISGLIMAMYVVVMYFTQSFAFGQYQIRIATSLYALAGVFPFLIFPMGVANSLSNILMGGFGVFDMVGGCIVGIATSFTVYFIRKLKLNDWLIVLPIIFIPGLVVPVWLSYLIGVPYKILAASVCIGQIVPAVLGVLLLKQLKRILYLK